METICIKVDENVLHKMDSCMKEQNYSTRTDFVREAIRDKIRTFETDKALLAIKRLYGSVKTKTPLEDDERLKEEAAREYARRRGIKLD